MKTRILPPNLNGSMHLLLRSKKVLYSSPKMICLLVVLTAGILNGYAKQNNTDVALTANVDVLQPSVLSVMGTSTDTSTLDIQDTIASIAAHIPAVVRHTGSGKIFHSEKYTYTRACHAAMLKWVADYPNEAAAFHTAVTAFLDKTDVNSLSYTQGEIYYDLQTQWLMVHYQN